MRDFPSTTSLRVGAGTADSQDCAVMPNSFTQTDQGRMNGHFHGGRRPWKYRRLLMTILTRMLRCGSRSRRSTHFRSAG
jgi:hypothetical protein